MNDPGDEHVSPISPTPITLTIRVPFGLCSGEDVFKLCNLPPGAVFLSQNYDFKDQSLTVTFGLPVPKENP